MHLLDQIDRWGRLTPDHAAHVSGEHILTYGELCAASDRLAGHFAADSSVQRAPIIVHGHKEPEMLVAFLAAVKAGRPYVPIDTSIPAQRMQRIVAGCGNAVVVTPERVRDWLGQSPSGATGRRVEENDPFYILFTSGSTGEPKGVVITLANLSAFVNWMRSEHRFVESRETFLNQAPFSFDLSVMDLYLSLATGGTLFSVTKDEMGNLPKLYRAFAKSCVTTWVSTPSFAQMCLVERTFNSKMISTIRRFLFCGETLPADTATQLLDRFPESEVWNTYGPTEATVATTSTRIDREMLARYVPLPIGRPMPATHVCIVDDELRRLADGERGEIVIAGPNVSAGYLNRPDLTARAFCEFEGRRAYRTGDLGHARDGMLFFDGRIDDQIKLFGHRIELGDLEANLRALPAIADAVVIPIRKNDRIDSLAAFVVLASRPAGSNFEIASELKKQLGERVPVYMLPRKFHFLDALPLTANGKADRRKLADAAR